MNTNSENVSNKIDEKEGRTSDDAKITNNPPFPRPKRKRRKAKSERGLPPDKDLAKLAKTYLEQQRQLWPQLVEAKLLPQPTPEVLSEMVADFKHRHQTGEVNFENVRPFQRFVSKLAGNYNRFSCDNSDENSILDQTVCCLEKAHQEDRFVPWEYVFADYSVTGLDASRQGYSVYKEVLSHRKNHSIETTYIDDFTRASRDEIEWWKLASLSKRMNKRLIGASDAFDLSDPNSDLLITMYGLLSRMFIKGIREKVKRGMKGAARRGTTLGKLPLGLTRREHQDQYGNIEYRTNGKPRTEICIDPETQKYRLLLTELFVEKNWSVYKITQHFNQLKVDGSDGWTESALKKLLWSPTAIGVFIWNRTRREFNSEEEKWEKVENPHSEWEVNYNPALAIVPLELWKSGRKKLAKMRANSPLTGRKFSRNQIAATTLFSGTLFCEYCGDELKLIRSTEKYKQMGCMNGPRHAHNCQLKSSKSTAILEQCLLTFLKEHVVTESAMQKLVDRVNTYLQTEAEKPQVDVSPLKSEARKIDAKIKKFLLRVESQEDQGLCDVYDSRIKELQSQLRPLRVQIREAEQLNRIKNIQPVDMDQCKAYLTDLRGLLSQDIPIAAEAIRALTGRITIRQEAIPGLKSGARWVATFTPDLVRMLQCVLQREKIPDSILLESANQTKGAEVKVTLEKIPEYEKLAPKMLELHKNGASAQSIGSAYGMCWDYVNQVLHFARTGERPKWTSGKRSRKRNSNHPLPEKYKQFADQVAHMRDVEKMKFSEITAQLPIGRATVGRAYDYAHRDEIRDAVEQGRQPDRGSYTHLGEEKYQQIREMLQAGGKLSVVAAEVGCGRSTVVRTKKKMEEENASKSTD